MSRAASSAIRNVVPPWVEVPDGIVEFATSERFLGLTLYPKQATLLKVMTLDIEALTAFDLRVLDEWRGGFAVHRDGDGARYHGAEGIVPDVIERMEWCRDQGRRWFREIVLVMGRRASKNYLASILVAWRLWHLLALQDPQDHYELPPTKALAVHAFGTDQATLRRNAYGDIAGLVRTAPCFAPLLGRETTTAITLLTPAQLAGGARPRIDEGSVTVVAAATTFTSGRGPAAPVLLFDEFAFVAGAGSTVTSGEIYDAATPAVMQFQHDALIMQVSSPWEKTGQLYKSYERGLAVEPNTMVATDPGTLVFHGPSWVLYEQDTPAETIPMWPAGPTFSAQEPKITEAQVNALEAQGHDVNVEYRAHFATATNAYLLPEKVAAIFRPWKGALLTPQGVGRIGCSYVGHADPSSTNANFAVAVGHLEDDDDGDAHVVFDLLRVWRPSDFPDGIVHYPTVEDEILRLITAFRIDEFTFDQYNSTGSIQLLNERVQAAGLGWRPNIHMRPATASHNFEVAEVFKTAVNLGRVHAPHHDLGRTELMYLVQANGKVEHPKNGPIQTDDVADAMMMVTWTLLHNRTDIFRQLGGMPLRASAPSGYGKPGDPHQALSEVGRSRGRAARPYNPARGFRR